MRKSVNLMFFAVSEIFASKGALSYLINVVFTRIYIYISNLLTLTIAVRDR